MGQNKTRSLVPPLGLPCGCLGPRIGPSFADKPTFLNHMIPPCFTVKSRSVTCYIWAIRGTPSQLICHSLQSPFAMAELVDLRAKLRVAMWCLGPVCELGPCSHYGNEDGLAWAGWVEVIFTSCSLAGEKMIRKSGETAGTKSFLLP